MAPAPGGHDAPGGVTSKVADSPLAREEEVEAGAKGTLSEQIFAPLGVYVAAGVALDNPAVAAAIGGRYRTSESFLLGVDGELNPWFSMRDKQFSYGVVNLYATGIWRFPVDDRVALRTSLHAGVSVLLQTMVGANGGSTGVYLGTNLIGLEYHWFDDVYLVLDPADVALPAPHLTGAPLTYLQYRLTVGLQIGAGD